MGNFYRHAHVASQEKVNTIILLKENLEQPRRTISTGCQGLDETSQFFKMKVNFNTLQRLFVYLEQNHILVEPALIKSSPFVALNYPR